MVTVLRVVYWGERLATVWPDEGKVKVATQLAKNKIKNVFANQTPLVGSKGQEEK